MTNMFVRWRRRCAIVAVAVLLIALFQRPADAATSDAGAAPLSVVVMDPLAAPLSCPCVAGYAQRKYEVLGEYLGEQLGRPVTVTFAESIAGALDKDGVDAVHLVIGKDSVVRAQSKKLKLDVKRLARLTGKDGKTTQTGLIVVRSADSAKTVADLAGYRIIFGPAQCDEKFAAARKLLTAAGVELAPPEEAEISESCSDGACMIIDWGDKVRGAAVISSYAAPLLEGCGTIKKGDLRVVGETKPVAFVAAFATNQIDDATQAKLQAALLASSKAPGMLAALESMLGFVPVDFKPVSLDGIMPPGFTPPAKVESGADATRPTADDEASAWPGWLGPTRDGRARWLPRQLAERPRIVWRKPLARAGLGGVAATDRYVLIGDRDAANRSDVFRCLDAGSGAELWTVAYPAPGQLDYDNSPRASPLIHAGRAYLLGAFGDLTCADLETGALVWQTNIRRQFLALDEMPWGTCSSPLVVDDMIVVNPGSPVASIAALDAATGKLRWQTPGEGQGYGSLIVATLGGVQQIVGHTQFKLHGWDPATGRELWSLKPRADGDFNVPTPIVVDGKLLVCTENNAARLYAFDEAGRIVPEPVAVNATLKPQVSTPIVVGERIYCLDDRLLALDPCNGLRTAANLDDQSFTEYGPLIATDDRLLAQGRGGEFVLVAIDGAEPRIVSRLALAENAADRAAELLTFPALVGTRLFVRLEREIVCVDLAEADDVATLAP
jgi:outer membrane protein assembly factor BamB